MAAFNRDYFVNALDAYRSRSTTVRNIPGPSET